MFTHFRIILDGEFSELAIYLAQHFDLDIENVNIRINKFFGKNNEIEMKKPYSKKSVPQLVEVNMEGANVEVNVEAKSGLQPGPSALLEANVEANVEANAEANAEALLEEKKVDKIGENLSISPPVKTPSPKSSPRSSPRSSPKHSGEKCQRIIKRRNGNKEKCGKNARNKIDTHWFCGVENTKSGCVGVILKQQQRTEEEKEKDKNPNKIKPQSKKVLKKKIPKTKSKPKTLKECKENSDGNIKRLLATLGKPKEESIKTQRIGEWQVIPNGRLVINPNTRRIIGSLGNDDRTFYALTDENIRYADTNSIEIDPTCLELPIRPVKPASQQNKSHFCSILQELDVDVDEEDEPSIAVCDILDSKSDSLL